MKGLRRWVIKAYHHQWWIPALSVVAIAALVGTLVLALVFLNDQRSQREAERDQAQAERDRRREADQAFCNLANDFRGQVISISDANEQLVHGVIDVVLPADAMNGERAAAIRAIREQIEPVFETYRDAVGEIRYIDCDALPGADPATDPEPPR